MIRWGRFWEYLHSLINRRRRFRRKLPNRPVIKPVIGGVIDEQRKICHVLEIIDATHWRGEWNGQVYECRMFPDTTGLTVGDAVVVHAMPNTTELWASYRPAEGGPELWFSPGSDTVNRRGQVWRAYPTPGGVQYSDYTIEQVWQGTDDYEWVTHMCWAKPATLGYVFSWWVPDYITFPHDSSKTKVRAYRITQDLVAPTLTLVAEVGGADLGITEFGDYAINPVLDSAQFLNHVFCVSNGWYIAESAAILKFDLNTETFSLVGSFPLMNGYMGGMATDSGNGVCFAHDGEDMYRSTDGTTWTWLLNMLANSNCADSSSMLTEYTTPLVYGGLPEDFDRPASSDAVFILDVAEAYAVDFQMPDPGDLGFVSLANQWNLAGTITDTWAQAYGWFSARDHGAWTKPRAGAWSEDWTGPTNDPGGPGEWDDAFIGLMQGIVYFDTKMWGLWWNWRDPAPNGLETRLYRRESAGNWTLVQTFTDREMVNTVRPGTGLIPLPSVGAGAAELADMLRQHEVN